MPDNTPIRDPKGNLVIIPPGEISGTRKSSYTSVKNVVMAPNFMIDVVHEGIYFIKLVSWELNLMVRTRTAGGMFIVEECIENPSIDLVSSLLKKGSLTSFQ